jgi:hypothetical protein
MTYIKTIFYLILCTFLIVACSKDNKPEDKQNKDSTSTSAESKSDSSSASANASTTKLTAESLKQISSDENAVEIITKAINARGGLDNYYNIKTMKLNLVMSAKDLSLPFTIYRKLPGMLRMESVIEGKKILAAVNNEKGWGVIPGTDSIEYMNGQQIEGFKYQFTEPCEFFLMPLIQMCGSNVQAEYAGKQKDGNKEALIIKLRDKRGEESTLFRGGELTVYIDPTTNLDYKYVNSAKTKEGSVESIIMFKDFKKFGDFTLPQKYETSINGEAFSKNVLNNIDINQSMDNSLFDPPVAK